MQAVQVRISGILRALRHLLLLAAAAAPIHGACAANSGIGGTGATANHSDNSGIGGTGAVANGNGGSGIGGTGAVASGSGIGGTGIVGTVTAFGSIFVNGVEIHYGAHTPLQINGHEIPLSRLAVGQVVAVETAKTGAQVNARSIRIMHAVSGPITRIEAGGTRFQVLGQTVALPTHTPIIGLPASPIGTPLRVDDYVQVSGLRRSDGVIVASLIRRTPPRAQVSVSGPVTGAGSFGLRIYGLVVHPANLADRTIADGTPVRITGTWAQGRLQSAHIEIEPSVPFGGRLAHLDLEGYVKSRQSPEQLRVGHVALRLTPATRFIGGDAQALTIDRRVRVSAHLDGSQRLAVDQIEFETDLPGADRSSADSTRSRRSHETDNEDHHAQSEDASSDRPESGDTDSAQPPVDNPQVDRPDFEAPEIEVPDISRPEVESPD